MVLNFSKKSSAKMLKKIEFAWLAEKQLQQMQRFKNSVDNDMHVSGY